MLAAHMTTVHPMLCVSVCAYWLAAGKDIAILAHLDLEKVRAACSMLAPAPLSTHPEGKRGLTASCGQGGLLTRIYVGPAKRHCSTP